MFILPKVTEKLTDGNIGHAQAIYIILFRFPNFPIIYLLGPVYYCPVYPSNTISSSAFKFYADFQKVTYEAL